MKNTNTTFPSAFPFPRLYFTHVPDSSTFLLLVQGRWIGNRGCDQSETTSVYVYSPSPHTCSVLQWDLSRSSSPSEQTCSRLESLHEHSVHIWSTMLSCTVCWGISAQHLEHNLFFFLLWPCWLQGCFSSFFSSLLTAGAVFSPILPEATPALLMGSVVSMTVSIGADWEWMCAAWSSSGLSSHPVATLPAPGHWQHRA